MKDRLPSMFVGGVLLLALVSGQPARGVNLVVDYSYDTTNFFGAGNPSGLQAGLQAKTSLEAATAFYSNLLNDTFSAITVPAPVVSSLPPQYSPGTFSWTWSMYFTHPALGTTKTLVDQALAANEYRIYAGARSLGGDTAGIGGAGSYSLNSNYDGGYFTNEEIQLINDNSDAFYDAVVNRGQASGFSRWGGAISFDSDGSTVWHYDHQSNPGLSELDFYSVALHELTHVLGFSGSTEWNAMVSGISPDFFFNGATAVSVYGQSVPLTSNAAHWEQGTESYALGTNNLQETAMSPGITDGTRKLITELDAAALIDLGWEITFPTAYPLGDLNGDQVVNNQDIAAFVLALTNPQALAQEYPLVNALVAGDINGDGAFNNQDIAPFVALLTGGGTSLGFDLPGSVNSIPEPTSLGLLLLGGLLLPPSRRRS